MYVGYSVTYMTGDTCGPQYVCGFREQLWVSVLTIFFVFVRVFLLLTRLAGPETARGFPASASHLPVESLI